ncbi:MAG TPA: hypothetical protein VFQ60_02500, partial [Patescibacteria group bacterium]|nr:hypothetical protein [Patescibacteria group bacterium]
MNGSRFISALLLVWVAFGVALPASAADAPICWCSINGDCKNASTLDQPAPTLATEKDCQNYCVKKGGRALNFDPQNYGTRTGPYCQLPDGEPVFCWCLGPTACENHAFYNDDGKTRFTCDNSGQPPSCAAFCASKGKGWQAIHCDANYVDETAYDDVCAKANGEAGLVRKTIKATPPETIPIAISINGATSVKDISDYIALAYKYSIGVAVILAIIMVIYGGFRYLLGSAAGSVEAGKKINFDAIMGMIIVLGAWLILHTVNPNTLTLRPPSLAIIQGLDIQTTINKVCHSDNDCGKSDNVACLLFDQSQGTCTDGSEGSMCSCRAGGCQRVKWATAVQLGFFRMGGWNSYSNSKDDPNDCT